MPIFIHKKYFIALLLCLGLFCHRAWGQSTTMGTDFWLGFMENNGGGTPVSVFISSPVATTGTVSIPGIAWTQNFVVAANTTTQVNIPAGVEVVGQSGVVLNRGIRVTANSPVYVYANSEKTGSSDAALILPKHLLGLDYLVLTHSTVTNSWNRSEFMVVATDNGTQIEIIPSVATQNGWPANVPQTVTLNQGQVVQVQAANAGDLTGTRVRAAGSSCGNSPTFAVFAGNVCVNIGGCTYCDHLFEQMIPVTKLGSQYVTVPLMDRTGGDFIKIMAITDNTAVQVNGNTVATLNCGQTHSLSGNVTTQACFITANRPVAVAQFSRGQSCDGTNFSDPFFILLSPIEVMPNTNVTISGMNLGSYFGHRVNIVTATPNTANVTCTCGPLAWVPVPGNPALSTARRAAVPGNSTINSTGTGFYATVYGWGGTSSATSYGYAGGGALIDLAFQINAPNQICEGDVINFSAQSSLPITEITWNFGDGSPPVTTGSPSHNFSKDGTYTITATISTNLSCGNVPNADQFCVTKIVQVVPNPRAALGNISGVCEGGSGQIPISITNASSGGTNYSWTLEYTINGQSQTQTGVGNSSFNLSFTNLLSDVNITLNSITINSGGINCVTPLNQTGVLVVSPPPSPNFTVSPAALCIGATATAALTDPQTSNTAYTWNFGGGLPANPNTVGPHTISWNSPGVKTISLQVLAPGCNPGSATQTVTVFPFPTSSFSANPNPICEFQQTTLAFSGTTQGNAVFLWSIPEQTGSFNTAGPFSLNWSEAGVKTLTLQTIENGCSSAVTTVLLTVNPNPVPDMVAEPTAICLDNTTRLTYTGTPASVYTWGCDGCNQGNPQGRGPHILSWTAPGVKTLSLRVATSEGCTSQVIQRAFEVFPLPNPPSAVLQYRCGAGVISFTASSPSGTAVRLFSQVSGGVPLQTAPEPYALETPHLAATTTLFLESVVLATGCSSSTRASIVAVVEPLPAPPSAADLNRCGPGPMTITALTGAPPANLVRLYTVSVEGTSVLTDNSAPFNFVINPAIVTTTYYLEAENTTTGCISPTRGQVVLTVHPIPGTPAVLPLERCGSGSVSFTPIINQPGGHQINIYTQPVGGAPRLSSTTQPFELTTFPLSQTSSFYIEYINTQTGCTSSRNTFVVTIKPVPLPPVQNSLERCGFGEFVFNPSITGGDLLRVYRPQNNLAAEIAAPYSYTTPVLETTATYYLTAYNTQTQCESPVTEVVALVNPQAKNPVLTTNAPVCLGEDMSIVATLQLDGVFYTWKRPGGKPDTVIQSPILWVRNAAYSDTGTYTVYAWTPQGCNAPPTSIRVGIRDLPLTPDVTFYNIFRESIPLCEGQEINLAVLNYPNYPEGTAFHWEGPNNFQHSPHPFPGVDTARVYSEGWYYVKAIYNGCTSKVGGVYVPVYPTPLKPLALNNSPICVGDSNLLTLSVGSALDNLRFEWVGPNNFIATGDIVQRQALPQNAGVYTLTAISQQGCRSKEAYTQVTFNQATTDLQFEAPSIICQGQALRLKANLIPGAMYHWSGPNNFSETTSLNEAVILQPGSLNSGLYSLTVTSNGCVSPTSTRFVAITPAPEKPIVTVSPVFCEGGALSLTVINPPAGGSIRFQGPNQVDVVSANPQLMISNISMAAAGLYRITTIANGCASSVTEIEVTVYPRPLVTAQSAPPQPCAGDSLMLFAQSVPGAQFRWSGPGGFSANSANAIRSGLTLQDAGAYNVYAIANGCTSIMQRVSVTVRNAPLITSISGENEVCQGAQLSLTANAIPGATYRWLGPNDFTASGPTLSINPATTVHSGLYSVQAVVAGCASAPFIQPVNIKPIPEQSQFFSNSPICAGSQLILTAIHSSPAVQFIITGPNGFNANGTGPNFTRLRVSVNDAGAYRLIAIVNGCTSSTQILNVAVNRAPSQPVLNAPNMVCEGATLQLSAVGEQGVQYIWQGPAGFFTTGNPVSLITHSTAASGNYTVRAVANGCTSSVGGRFIQVQSAPATPVIQSNLPLCRGEALYLTVSNPQNNFTYEWEGPANFTAAGTTISRTLDNPEYAGQYTVRAFNGACASPAATAAVVFDEKPFIIAESNSPICEGDGLQLEATLIPGASYKWSGPYNFEVSERNPFRANATTVMSGNYYVVAQLGACVSDPVSVTVQVAPRPAAPVLSGAMGPYCEGQNLVLNASGSAGANFLWNGPAGFISEERSPILTNVTTANSGTYAVVARQGNCLSLPAQTQVLIERVPSMPIITGVTALCAGQNLQLSASSTPDALFTWNGPNGFNTNQAFIALSNLTTAQAGRYSVFARLGNCTSRVASVEVSVTNKPAQPRLGNNGPVCEGSTLQLTTEPVIGAGYSWSGPGGFVSSLQSPSIENIRQEQVGVYSLTVVAGGCSSNLAITQVAVNPAPQIVPLHIPSSVCAGQNLRLEVQNQNNVQYSWQGPAGYFGQGALLQIPNFQANNGGVYTLTATLGACTARQTFAVQAVPAFPRMVAGSNSPLCEGQELVLSVTQVAGAQYYWSGPAGFEANVIAPERNEVTPSASGVYSVYAVVGNCTSAVVTTAVTVTPLPVSLQIQSNAPVCAGNPIELSVASQPGLDYTWLGPNGFSVTGTRATINNATASHAGVYSLTIRNGNCVRTFTAEIAVRQGPGQVRITAPSQVCEGANLALSANPITGAIYQWNGPNGFSATGVSVTNPLVSASAAGVYSLIAIVNGCTSQTATANVAVALNRTITATSNAPICEGETLYLSVDPEANTSYFWAGPDNFRSSNPFLNISGASLGHSGVYSLTAIQNGCTVGNGVIEVRIKPTPILQNITSNAPVCAGGDTPLQLNVDPIANAQYLWSGPANFMSVNRTPLVSQPVAGAYTVIAIVEGCTSAPKTITVQAPNGPGEVKLGNNGPLCGGQTLQLTASAAPGSIFEWAGPEGFRSTQQNPTITSVHERNQGIYSVIAILGNCTSRAYATEVEIYPAPPPITATANGPLCAGQTLHLQVTTIPAATYQWSGPGGFTHFSQNPVLENVKSEQAGTYSVSALLGVCPAQTASVAVEVLPAPGSIFAGNNGPVCSGETLSLSATQAPGAVYEWRGPGGFVSSSPQPTLRGITPEQSGAYSVIVRLGGCAAPLAVTEVRVLPAPNGLAAGSNAPICADETLSFTATTFSGASYKWIGPLGYASSEQNPVIANVATEMSGVYSVIANIGVCTAIASAPVEVRDCRQCPSPSAPTLTVINNNAVLLSWSPPAVGVVCAILSYGPLQQNPDNWSTQIIPGAQSSFQVTGLAPGVEYGFRLRYNCQHCSQVTGNRSEWSRVANYLVPARQTAGSGAVFLKAFPNPTQGLLIVEGFAEDAMGKVHYRWVNSQGGDVSAKVNSLILNGERIEFDLNALSAGHYRLVVYEAERGATLVTFPIIKVE